MEFKKTKLVELKEKFDSIINTEEKNNIGTEDKQEKVDKFKDKKNAFTMTYILVGITIIAILGLLVYALIVSN